MSNPKKSVFLLLAAGYWYRDDSLVLWDAIWKFVEAILSLYYKDDMAVAADAELSAMLAELRQNAIKSMVSTVLILIL